MYLKGKGTDVYYRNGEGLLQFLNDYNLYKEFYAEYKKDIDIIMQDDDKESIDTEEKVLSHLVNNYVMSSLLCFLFYKYPTYTRKGLGYTMEERYDIENSTEEEALDIVVELIRKNNFSTEDIFNKVLQTS